MRGNCKKRYKKRGINEGKKGKVREVKKEGKGIERGREKKGEKEKRKESKGRGERDRWVRRKVNEGNVK